MGRRLIFDPAVPDDLSRATAYYDSIAPELADRFRTQMDRCWDRISENPESYPFDIAPIRFASVKRFPYLVFFVSHAEFVDIIAIAHGSSNPQRWRSRRP